MDQAAQRPSVVRDYLNPELERMVVEREFPFSRPALPLTFRLSDYIADPDQQPRKAKSLLITAALVAAVGFGGASAYFYKHYIASPQQTHYQTNK